MPDAADHGAVTLQDDDGNIFKVNGQRLKVFLEQEMPELEEVDVDGHYTLILAANHCH